MDQTISVEKKKATSFSLSGIALERLLKLAERSYRTKTAMIELLIDKEWSEIHKQQVPKKQ